MEGRRNGGIGFNGSVFWQDNGFKRSVVGLTKSKLLDSMDLSFDKTMDSGDLLLTKSIITVMSVELNQSCKQL